MIHYFFPSSFKHNLIPFLSLYFHQTVYNEQSFYLRTASSYNSDSSVFTLFFLFHTFSLSFSFYVSLPFYLSLLSCELSLSFVCASLFLTAPCCSSSRVVALLRISQFHFSNSLLACGKRAFIRLVHKRANKFWLLLSTKHPSCRWVSLIPAA